MREDYQVGLPEHLQEYKDKLVKEWVKSGRMINSRPYQRKPAYYPQLQEERSDSSRTWSRAQGSLPKDSSNLDRIQPSVFGSVSSVDRRRLPPPTSISVALNRNHPLSHFPNLNSNTTGAANKGFNDDDPHNPWTTVHSGRPRNVCAGSAHPNKNTRFANQQEERLSVRGEQRSEAEFTSYNRSQKNGGPPVEVSLRMETDPQVEEDHQDLGILPVERMAICIVQEDIRVVSTEDHLEATLTEEDPVIASIWKKRRAKENGN